MGSVMPAAQAHIIEKLRRDILSLQGLAKPVRQHDWSRGLGPISQAFPNQYFPTSAVHEFLVATAEEKAASSGFIAGLISSINHIPGVMVWIGTKLQVYPHAYKFFGIDPEKIIFVSLDREKDVLWAVEESLKCEGLSAVVGELRGLSFDVSRRLQLAVEKSHVTGFILNHNTSSINANTCVSRWKISHLPSAVYDDLPGIGFPRWQVDLLKVRNGQPGSWQVEWSASKFRFETRAKTVGISERRKTG
jgi:Uncharacterized conserved protein